MKPLSATVVITTKNRRDELATALDSALAQTARPQILVIDDASTDGTSDLVRSRYPTVLLHRAEKSQGLIVQRNTAARRVTTDIIVSIDDDAAFSTPHTLNQTLNAFDHPRIGAIAIPFVDVRQSPHVHQLAPDGSRIYVAASFMGTAHAIRRDLFLALGGYNEFLFHQGEERDLCVRMLSAGYVVRLGFADPIHHFESPHRDFRRRDLYGRRNEILHDWHNVPWPYLPWRILATTLSGLRFGIACGRPFTMLRGIARGYAAIFRRLTSRHPVSRRTYQLFRRLSTNGPVPLEEIESMLPSTPWKSAPFNGSNSALIT